MRATPLSGVFCHDVAMAHSMAQCRFCEGEILAAVPGLGGVPRICVSCEDAIVARADAARARADYGRVPLEQCVVCHGAMARSTSVLTCSSRCAHVVRRASARCRERAVADSAPGCGDGAQLVPMVACRFCGCDLPGRDPRAGSASTICVDCERAIVERAEAARARPQYGRVALEVCAVCLGAMGRSRDSRHLFASVFPHACVCVDALP